LFSDKPSALTLPTFLHCRSLFESNQPGHFFHQHAQFNHHHNNHYNHHHYLLPQTTTPLYNTTLLAAYNGIAKVFNNLKAGIYKHSEAVAEFVPALPLCELTDDAESVLRRAIQAGRDLFAFAEGYKSVVYDVSRREPVRYNVGNLGLVSLLNDYKYRPLGEYGLVASVFNRRNVVGLSPCHRVTVSRCR